MGLGGVAESDGDAGVDTLVVRARLRTPRWLDALVVTGALVGMMMLGGILLLGGALARVLAIWAAFVVGSFWRRTGFRLTTRGSVRLTPIRLEVGAYSYRLDGLRGLDWEGSTLRVHIEAGSIEHHAEPENEASRTALVDTVRRQLKRRGQKDEVPVELGRLRTQRVRSG